MATALLKDVHAAISPRGDYVAITAGDGRVKTWDVVNGQLSGEFTEIAADSASALANAPGGHLAVEYTALSWGLGPPQMKKKKRPGASLLTLGTGAGDVLGWDPTVGELKWRTSDCNSGAVKSICFSKTRHCIYVAGSDGMISELNASGEILNSFRASKSSVSAVAVSPDGTKLIAGGNDLKLLNLDSRKGIRKFTGHASSVRALAFTGDGKYVISAAVGDRNLVLWDCEGSAKGASLSLTMENPAVVIDSCGFGKEGKPLCILSVSETGEVYVWKAMSFEELSNSVPVRVSVQYKKSGKSTSSASRQCILFAQLLGSDSIFISRGTTVKPSFETLSLPDKASNILLEASCSGELLSNSHQSDKSTKSEQAKVTVLGADNAADATILKPRIEQAAEKPINRKKRRASSEADEGGDDDDDDGAAAAATASSKKGIEEESDVVVPMAEDVEEETMEERLMALGLIEDQRSVGNAVENAAAVDQVNPPKADSLDVLLSQALHADDNDLLEQCFRVTNDKVIANTISKLNYLNAAKLLKAAIAKLEARPRKALQLLPWVRTALLEHASAIMSNPSMEPALTVLLQIIEARLHVFRPLLSLSGRLDLITSHIKASEARTKEAQNVEAPVVYEEEDSDDDVEDAMVDDDDDEEEGDGDGDGDDVDEDDDDDAMDVDGHTQQNGGKSSDNESEDSDE